MKTTKLMRFAIVLALTAVLQLVIYRFEVHFLNLIVFYIVADIIAPEVEQINKFKK